MNSKGQVGVGTILVMAIAVIVCLTLLSATFADIGTVTNKIVVANETVTFPANGSSLTLKGQAFENLIVTNKTGGEIINSGNYTENDRVVSNGGLIDTITATSNHAATRSYYSQAVNVSYTYEPFGYDTNSGTRAVTSLIVVFAALALIVTLVVPITREWIFDSFR